MDHDPSSSVRIAVLIDADNTSPKYAEALLEELAKYGTPTIKRAYGDFSSPRLGGWTRELNARAIRAIHQNAFTVGKNSTDSALIIDAMDLLYAGNVEAFALVSSDSDFTGLALRLRESGKVVYGLGRQRTPQSLQNACDRFIALEVLGEESAADDATGAAPDDDAPKLNLESVLTRAVNATADDEGWTDVSAIGNHLSRTQASFDPRNFGHAKLSSLVAAQTYLESQTEGRQILVRLAGRPAKGAKPAAATSDSGVSDSGQQAPKKTATKQAATKKSTAKQAASKDGAGQPADKDATKASAKDSAEDSSQDAAAETPTAQPTTKRTTRTRKTASATKAPTAAPADQSTPSPEAAPAKPTVTKTARKRTAKKAAPETPTGTPTEAAPEPATPEPTKSEPAKPVVTRRTRTPRKTAPTPES